MPIVRTIAVSRNEAASPSSALLRVIGHRPVAWVSITDPGMPPVTTSALCPPRLALQFEDDLVSFTSAEAERVVRFLRAVHALSIRSFLLVNCELGLSRSGAVATYVAETFGAERVPTTIWPNPHVLKLLRSARL